MYWGVRKRAGRGSQGGLHAGTPTGRGGGLRRQGTPGRKGRREVECTRCARPPPSRSRDASTSLSLISQAPSLSTNHRVVCSIGGGGSHFVAFLPLCRHTRWSKPYRSATSGTHYSKSQQCVLWLCTFVLYCPPPLLFPFHSLSPSR